MSTNNKNKILTISVTKKDIENAKERRKVENDRCKSCPIAQSFRRRFKNLKVIVVGYYGIGFHTKSGEKFELLFDEKAKAFVRKADVSNDSAISPARFSFEIPLKVYEALTK